MSTAANRQYLAHIVALKQAVVASKPRAKIPGAAGKSNARVLACEFLAAATITSLAAIWSFAICNLLVADLALIHLARSRTRSRARNGPNPIPLRNNRRSM